MYKREKQIRKFFKNDDIKYTEYLITQNDEPYRKSKVEVEKCYQSGLKPPWQLVDFVKKHEELISRLKIQKAYKEFLKADKALRDHCARIGLTPEQVEQLSEDELQKKVKEAGLTYIGNSV